VVGSYKDMTDDKYMLQLSPSKPAGSDKETQDDTIPLSKDHILRIYKRIAQLLHQSFTNVQNLTVNRIFISTTSTKWSLNITEH
jgi:hypothetical protein